VRKLEGDATMDIALGEMEREKRSEGGDE